MCRRGGGSVPVLGGVLLYHHNPHRPGQHSRSHDTAGHTLLSCGQSAGRQFPVGIMVGPAVMVHAHAIGARLVTLA